MKPVNSERLSLRSLRSLCSLRLNALLVSALCLCASVVTSRAQSIITATVTVTNTAGTTNGNSITLNSVFRQFTNNVTAAQNQILASNTISAAASNLWLAYVIVPAPKMHASRVSTNIVQFQTDPGTNLVISLGGSWGTVTYSTNTIATNQAVVSVPSSAFGNIQQTNIASGLIAWIGSSKATNTVPTNAPAFANFLSSGVAITNFILTLSTNGTNNSLMLSVNGTNNTTQKIVALSNNVWAIIGTLGTAATHSAADFQPACDVLTNLCSLGPSFLNGLSYIESPNNILLKHTNTGPTIERLRADSGGEMSLKFEDGTTFLRASTGHYLYLYDYGGTARFESVDAGATYLRGKNSVDSLKIDENSDVIKTYSQVAFNENVMPAVAIGTVTNFLTSVANSGSSDTDRNVITIPANALAHDGDTITRVVGCTLAANGNSKKIQISFNANPVMTVAGVTLSAGQIFVKVTLTRTSSSTYAYVGTGTTGQSTPGAAGSAYASAGSAGSIDFTSAMTFKLILTGTSTSDITTVVDRITFAPSSDYAN